MADFALVVGIECYETPLATELQGPSLDALRFALWLVEKQKVPPRHVFLFQNKGEWNSPLAEIYDGVRDKVIAAGIEVRTNPTRTVIEEAWRKQLLSGPLETGTLWVYWSGHGLTFPQSRDAVLCSNSEFDNPSYVYLAEFRDSLRSDEYRRFQRQRLIVDACAEYLSPEDLKMKNVRNPVSWTITQTPEQVELNAVAIGFAAVAERGGSLFSRALMKALDQFGWSDDPRVLYKAVKNAIASETAEKSKLPRLRVFSPRYEEGIEMGVHAEECKLLREMLWQCNIPFESYQPAYLRTMGNLTSDRRVLSASSLTDMLLNLLQLDRAIDFGNWSIGLVEFLERVKREFKRRSAPVEGWMKTVPPAARAGVQAKLDREASDLILTIYLIESTGNRDGFPASIRADLCDANFSRTILTWHFANLMDLDELETQARVILRASDGQARRQKEVNLSVQVFANPPLLGVPWHAYRVDPADDIDYAVFGQSHSFILRSRDRHQRHPKYDLDSWRQKSRALRKRHCKDIAIAAAPAWRADAVQEVNDALAKVDGLLLISDTLNTWSMGNDGLYKLLTAALRRGLPLASWPISLVDTKENGRADLAPDLKRLLEGCKRLANTPDSFRNARKSEKWARDVALFWDDCDSKDPKTLNGEEPSQL